MRRSAIASILALAVGVACLGPSRTATAGGLNSFHAGLNGILTAPADPFVRAFDPPSELEELPFAIVTSHAAGLFTGVFLGTFRLTTGIFDIALSPLWVAPTLSPRATFEIIPWYDIDYRY